MMNKDIPKQKMKRVEQFNAGYTTRPDWINESLYPFKSRYIELAGSLVHYIDEGSGPVLLFLHSFPTWSFIYRNIIKNLKSNFRCIALDYPGFGLSKPSDGFIHTLKNHSEMKGYLTEVKQGLGHLRVLPALLIFGNEDPTFEAGFMNRFEQIFSRSHSVILKGAGHFTPEEAPDEITSVIKSWWQSLQEQV